MMARLTWRVFLSSLRGRVRLCRRMITYATISRWDPGHLRGLGPISIVHGGFCQVRWP
jgi:hypothetical protein